MEVSEIIKSLKLLIEKGTKISDIEKEIGMPENNLSSILKEKRVLPKKWIQPLEDYINFGSRKMIELPKDFIGFDKIGILRADGTIEELKDFEQLPQSFKLAARALYELPITDKPIYQYPLEEKDCYKEETYYGTKAEKSMPEIPDIKKLTAVLEIDNIKKQIEALKAEKCPSHITTPLGKKSWNFDHQKRILELEKQLT